MGPQLYLDAWHGTTQYAYQKCLKVYGRACEPCRRINREYKQSGNYGRQTTPGFADDKKIGEHGRFYGCNETAEKFSISVELVREIVSKQRFEEIQRRKRVGASRENKLRLAETRKVKAFGSGKSLSSDGDKVGLRRWATVQLSPSSSRARRNYIAKET